MNGRRWLLSCGLVLALACQGVALDLGGGGTGGGGSPAAAALLCSSTGGNTNNSSSGAGSDVAHNLTCTVPANTFLANTTLNACVTWRVTTGSAPPNLTTKLKSGATTLSAPAAALTPPASKTNFSTAECWQLTAAADPGAAVNVYVTPLSTTADVGGVNTANSVAQPLSLATNGALILTVTSQWSAVGTGTTTITEDRLSVQVLPLGAGPAGAPVLLSGVPATGQAAEWVDSTHVKGVNALGAATGAYLKTPGVDDQLFMSTSTTGAWVTIPDCPQGVGYTQATNTWACITGVSDGDKGDLTVASSGTVWTIDPKTVTYAKMQDVSATQRLMGRTSAGAGPMEELTAAQAKAILAPSFTDLTGTATDAQVPDLNTLSTGLAASRCVQTDGTGKLGVAAGLCGTGTGGATGFDAITSGTNTTAAMVVGTGGSLGTSGSGSIIATTATAFDHDPGPCGAGLYATDQNAAGALGCAQVQFSHLGGTATDSQIPDLNTLSTGLTASRCVETDSSGKLSVTAGTCGTGAGGAPTDAHYLTTQAEPGLSAESNLGALSTGLLKIGVTGGVATPSTAVAGTDYLAPAGAGLLRGNGTSTELSGDATTSGSNVVTVGKVNGTTYPASPAVDTVPTVTAPQTVSYRTIPDCDDTIGQHLNYDTTTHQWSCGNSTRTVPAFTILTNPASIGVDSTTYNEVRVAELNTSPVNLDAPTGSPFEGQRLTYSLYSTVSRQLTYTTSAGGFAGEAGLNLPAKTIAGAYLILEFRWSAQSTRWALVSVSDRRPKVATFGDVAAITINSNTTELATYAMASATQSSYTVNNPTGTPFDGQPLRVRVTTAVGAPAKPLIWGSEFTGNAGLPLPTTTTGGGTQDVFGFSRNEADSTWVLLATTQSSLSARRKTCMMLFGGTSGPAMSDSDLVELEYCSIPTNATIEEIEISALSSGTPSIMVHQRSGGTNTALLSSALATAAAGGFACARLTAVTGFRGYPCQAKLQNVTTSGEVDVGTTSGTASTSTVKVLIRVHYLLAS